MAHIDYSTQPINLAYAGKIGNECLWLLGVLRSGQLKILERSSENAREMVQMLNNASEQSSFKMVIVYAVNLMESFMQDFICYKEGFANVEDNKVEFTHLVEEEYAEYRNSISEMKTNTSKSFMNIRFSLFVLSHRYGIEFPEKYTPAIPELGSLRNCIVHRNEKLDEKDRGGNSFIETMPNIINLLSPVGNKIDDYNKGEFVQSAIQDLQTFIYEIVI